MRIPIKDVKALANKCELSLCIVFGVDQRGFTQQVASWGRSIEDCDQAARTGNAIKKIMGWPANLQHAEPSRVRKLQARIKELEEDRDGSK